MVLNHYLAKNFRDLEFFPWVIEFFLEFWVFFTLSFFQNIQFLSLDYTCISSKLLSQRHHITDCCFVSTPHKTPGITFAPASRRDLTKNQTHVIYLIITFLGLERHPQIWNIQKSTRDYTRISSKMLFQCHHITDCCFVCVPLKTPTRLLVGFVL